MNNSDKWIAWNLDAEEQEFFKTEAEAKEFCEKELSEERSTACEEGWGDFISEGGIGYAKIIADSQLIVSDKKSNYMCSDDPTTYAECSICDKPEGCCGEGEEWPYNDDFDTISECVLKEKEKGE
jgi:hypothetical protein